MVASVTMVPRLAQDGDSQDLFGLIALCFAQYPGCLVDPHDDLSDLLRPGLAFAERGGAFFVCPDATGRVCACIAFDIIGAGVAEMHRLYVRPDRRGAGLGADLVRHVENAARQRGCTRLELWSDTRFAAAHRLYGRLGYRPAGRVRELGDVSHSSESLFLKDL